MDAAKVSAGQIEHLNGTGSGSSLKRKRVTATHMFPTKHPHQEGFPATSSEPQRPAVSLVREHTEIGGMDSRYRFGGADLPVKPIEARTYSPSYDDETARSRNQGPKTRDIRTTPDEQSGLPPSNRRHIVDNIDRRSSKPSDDQLARTRAAEEYKKNLKQQHPKGPSYHPSQKSEGQSGVNSRKTSTDATTLNATNATVQLLTRFVSDATRQVSLQVRRDASKRTLDRTMAEFEKGRQYHSNFKSIEEVQRSTLDRAQREFEEVERELQETRAASTAIIEDLASRMTSNSGNVSKSDVVQVESKVSELSERIMKYRTDWGVTKNKQGMFDKEWRQAQVKNRADIAALSGDMSGLGTKLEEVKDREIVDLRKSVDKLSARASEFPNRLIQMSKEISEIKDRSTEIKVLEKSLSEQMQAISELRSQIYGDIDDSNNNGLKHTISRIEQDHQRFRSALGTFEQLMSNFSSRPQEVPVEPRLQAMEERLIKMEGSQSKTIAPSGPLSFTLESFENAQKGLRVRVDGLQEAQDRADEIIGSAIQSLESKSEDLERFLNSLREKQEQEVSQLSSQIEGLKAGIDAAHAAVATATTNINANTNNVKVADDIKSLHTTIQGVMMGLANLDSRMNNLTTDNLARQILGQLDEHVRSAETRLQKLEFKVHAQERLAREPPTAIPQSVRVEIDALTSSLKTIQADVNESRMNFTENLKTHTDQMRRVEALLDSRGESVPDTEYPSTAGGDELEPPKPSGGDGAKVSGRWTTNGHTKRKRQSELFVHSDSDGEDNDQRVLDTGGG